mgnify:CR=1 FL=1
MYAKIAYFFCCKFCTQKKALYRVKYRKHIFIELQLTLQIAAVTCFVVQMSSAVLEYYQGEMIKKTKNKEFKVKIKISTELKICNSQINEMYSELKKKVHSRMSLCDILNKLLCIIKYA